MWIFDLLFNRFDLEVTHITSYYFFLHFSGKD